MNEQACYWVSEVTKECAYECMHEWINGWASQSSWVNEQISECATCITSHLHKPTLGSRGFSLSEGWGRKYGRRGDGSEAEPPPGFSAPALRERETSGTQGSINRAPNQNTTARDKHPPPCSTPDTPGPAPLGTPPWLSRRSWIPSLGWSSPSARSAGKSRASCAGTWWGCRAARTRWWAWVACRACRRPAGWWCSCAGPRGSWSSVLTPGPCNRLSWRPLQVSWSINQLIDQSLTHSRKILQKINRSINHSDDN